jgi:predicted patatin/cPLA2 family phospholipase
MFEIIRNDLKLDWQRLLDSPISLHPTSFCLDEWQTVDLGHPESEEQLFERLRASAQVPLFAGRPIELAGKRYLDAACGEFIPVQTALAGGATHVLALHTRPQHLTPPPLGRVERLLYRRSLGPIDRRFVEHYENLSAIYQEEMGRVHALGEHVYSVFPAATAEPLSPSERRREPIEQAFKLGSEALLAIWPAQEPERQQSLRGLLARRRARTLSSEGLAIEPETLLP